MYGTYGDTGNFMEYLQSATYFFKDNEKRTEQGKKERKKEKEKHRKRVEKRNERKKKSKKKKPKKNKVEKVPRSRATCFTFRRIT